MSDNFSITESVITFEDLLEKIPSAAINQRQYSLSIKDNTTFDSAQYQLKSITSLPSYYNEVEQLKTSAATSIESNEESDEYCITTQIINSCINTDSNHLEIIPVTSRLHLTYLVNDLGYIAGPNGTSNNDTDYTSDKEYDHDQSFNNILQIDTDDFCDVCKSPQTVSKECTADESGYIHSINPKMLTIPVKDGGNI